MTYAVWPIKDPASVVDGQIDWSVKLGTDTITASTWTVPAGITKQSDSIGTPATSTTIWVSGGTAGEVYQLHNHIITVGGRQYDKTVLLPVNYR